MEDGQRSLSDLIEERQEEMDQPFPPDIIEKVIRYRYCIVMSRI
jgi:hypothetical protein